jgi:hypothetical protein
VTESISADEFNALQQERPAKYRNHKTTVDGVVFDSKAEARRYGELRLLEQAGQIEGLVLQPRFDLEVNGVKLGYYRADYMYYDNTKQRRIVEDVKSRPTMTPVYRLKKKLMRACHGIEITEVTA